MYAQQLAACLRPRYSAAQGQNITPRVAALGGVEATSRTAALMKDHGCKYTRSKQTFVWIVFRTERGMELAHEAEKDAKRERSRDYTHGYAVSVQCESGERLSNLTHAPMLEAALTSRLYREYSEFE